MPAKLKLYLFIPFASLFIKLCQLSEYPEFFLFQNFRTLLFFLPTLAVKLYSQKVKFKLLISYLLWFLPTQTCRLPLLTSMCDAEPPNLKKNLYVILERDEPGVVRSRKKGPGNTRCSAARKVSSIGLAAAFRAIQLG